MVELELDNDTLRANFDKYGPLLCDSCKESLSLAAKPLAEKLNAGKRPTTADMLRLLGALCNDCAIRIANEKNKGLRA